MSKHKIFFMALIMLGFSVSVAQSGKNNFCSVDTGETSFSSWQECNGKLVKVKGRVSGSFFGQHPVGIHDTMDIVTFQHNRKYETDVDIGGRQVVLSYPERIECQECIDIEGIVDIVDLGGEEGTRGSYGGLWIKVLNFRCVKCDL